MAPSTDPMLVKSDLTAAWTKGSAMSEITGLCPLPLAACNGVHLDNQVQLGHLHHDLKWLLALDTYREILSYVRDIYPYLRVEGLDDAETVRALGRVLVHPGRLDVAQRDHRLLPEAVQVLVPLQHQLFQTQGVLTVHIDGSQGEINLGLRITTF